MRVVVSCKRTCTSDSRCVCENPAVCFRSRRRCWRDQAVWELSDAAQGCAALWDGDVGGGGRADTSGQPPSTCGHVPSVVVVGCACAKAWCAVMSMGPHACAERGRSLSVGTVELACVQC
eukprot:2186673-Rhodomonas_salina.1